MLGEIGVARDHEYDAEFTEWRSNLTEETDALRDEYEAVVADRDFLRATVVRNLF